MFTHVFYHQETVEPICALNSWLSIRNFFSADDEVIVLDLGMTLNIDLPLKNVPKHVHIERIRTDIPEERSYTFGLNYIIPKAKYEWVIVWRSDYVYSRNYFSIIKNKIAVCDVIVPYEAFIGASYCGYKWCKQNLDRLIDGNEKFILRHSTVCPIYESLDFPHFAIRKQIYNDIGGMNDQLYGYGPQFPELFYRISKKDGVKFHSDNGLIAFHQMHKGSFGLNILDSRKKIELEQAKKNLTSVYGSVKNADDFFFSIRQPPLFPRRDPSAYILKDKKWKYYLRLLHKSFLRRDE